MPLKISISGVRGTVPDSLTAEVCLNFAKAFGAYLNKGKVVVGTDSRASSEFIKGIIFSGLLSCGCSVIDIGICPTPTVGIMLRELKADGGIVITASHNPLPWNGLKFLRGDGIFLNEKEANKLLEIYTEKNFNAQPSAPAKKQVLKNYKKALEFHVNKILKHINVQLIRKSKFKVVLDPCNGAGSIVGPMLLKKLGCRIFEINSDPSKPFAHSPEPIAENLVELCEKVKEVKADIGFAQDSDADRLAIVSELGEPLGEEYTLALAVDFMLDKRKFKEKKEKIVITNLSTSKMIDDIVKKYNGLLLRTKVGEVNVAEEIKKCKAVIGGEGNGGIIFPKIGFNRDSLISMAIILNIMAQSKKKISELTDELPKYYMCKTKIECSSQEAAEEMIEKVKNHYKNSALDLTEGVKVLLKDAWLHVRASNTEPIVRIIAEARNKSEAEKLANLLFTA